MDEDHHRLAVEMNPHAIWTARPDGQLDYASPRWREWTETSGLGDTWAAAVHPHDLPKLKAAWSHSLGTGSPLQLEHRVRVVGGEYRWMRSSASARRSDSGQIIKWYGTTEDIHDLKKAEERLRLALEGGRIATWEWNLETDQTTWSGNAMELFGLTTGHTKQFEDRVHPDDWDRHQAAFKAAIATGAHYEMEMCFVRPDGQVIWVLDRGELHIEPTGERALTGITVDITARKQAEAEAQVKAGILEATLESMDQGLMMFDASDTIHVFNKRAAALLDIPESLLATRPTFRQIIEYQFATDDFALSDEAFGRWVAESGVRNSRDVYERVRPNGTVLEIRTVPLSDGGAVRTYTDITARRRAEAGLVTSEERHRLAAQATAEAIWDWDIINDTVTWSEAIETVFGYGREDVGLYSSWRIERVHPDEREQVIQSIRTAHEKGAAHWGAEYRFRRADGTYAHVVNRGLILRDADGQPVRSVGAMRDVSERKKAETLLQTSEERHRALIEAGVSVVWRADPSGLILSAEGRGDFIGQPLSEYVGQGWLERLHPDDRPKVASVWMGLRTSRESGEVEYRVKAPDGAYHWVRSRAVPLQHPDGSIKEWVGTLTDVTQRRQLEAQLQQAQKMEAVGQLTGGIAHDFNNLLTVILGNAELLTEDLTEPQPRELAVMIQQAAEKGADLTKHLLAFGRRQSLNPERLNVGEVVTNLEPLLRRTLGAHIDLVTELRPVSSAALTDRTLLESAVLNLVVNARDAMPQGGTLTIRVGQTVAGVGEGTLPFGQPVVFVTVSDTGTGIAPEVLSRVFDPFFTTKEAGKGTGLGLSMVYGFAEQTGGHVSIESHVGHGTSVTILLRAVSPAAPRLTSIGAGQAVRGGAKVLVVEDDASVRRFVCSQIASLGYDVTAVEAAPEAIDLLEQDQGFQLLFTDVVLPRGMSGVELAKQAQRTNPTLKILLTSGYSEESFEQHGRPEEGTPLLRKPYKRTELADMLRRVLEDKA